MVVKSVRKIIVMVLVKGDATLKALNAKFTKLNNTAKSMKASLTKMKLAFAAFLSFGSLVNQPETYYLLDGKAVYLL